MFGFAGAAVTICFCSLRNTVHKEREIAFSESRKYIEFQ